VELGVEFSVGQLCVDVELGVEFSVGQLCVDVELKRTAYYFDYIKHASIKGNRFGREITEQEYNNHQTINTAHIL
jgi:trimethylamine:corrinoid methyltransferase-like protein